MDAGSVADAALDVSAAGGAAGATTGNGGGGTSGSGDGGSAGATGGGGSAGSGTAGSGGDSADGAADDASSDASSAADSTLDAAALCAPFGLNLPFAKVTYAEAAAPPDSSTYSGGTLVSGKHYLTGVTHYGGGVYAGAKQAQYTIDANAGTIQIGEFTTSGADFIGMTYVQIDAHTLEATVVCDTDSGASGSQQFYYTVATSVQGSSLTLAPVGSSDVLTIGPP
jgi:hypothetical protein